MEARDGVPNANEIEAWVVVVMPIELTTELYLAGLTLVPLAVAVVLQLTDRRARRSALGLLVPARLRVGAMMLERGLGAVEPVRSEIRRFELMSREAKAKALFGVAAFLSFLLSVSLWFSGQREEGLFVGLWVPSILSLGALLLAGSRARHV